MQYDCHGSTEFPKLDSVSIFSNTNCALTAPSSGLIIVHTDTDEYLNYW